jgi:hypothetical protein
VAETGRDHLEQLTLCRLVPGAFVEELDGGLLDPLHGSGLDQLAEVGEQRLLRTVLAPVLLDQELVWALQLGKLDRQTLVEWCRLAPPGGVVEVLGVLCQVEGVVLAREVKGLFEVVARARVLLQRSVTLSLIVVRRRGLGEIA